MKKNKNYHPQSKIIDAHLLKQLFEDVQKRFSNLNFSKRKDYEELEVKITAIYYSPTHKKSAISSKTLLKYWGIDKYGVKGRRYTPDSDYLSILAEVCGTKNWDQFKKEVGFKIVTNVLPYERKQKYWDNGIWLADSAKIGDVVYFGNENKYIAFQKKKFGLELFDFKNIPCFTTFSWHEIEGVEVIKNENQEISIRIIY